MADDTFSLWKRKTRLSGDFVYRGAEIRTRDL